MPEEIKLTENEARVLRFFLETEWAAFVDFSSDFDERNGGLEFANQIFKSLGGEE